MELEFETAHFLATWDPDAIVLTVEIRKCKTCGGIQTIPGGRLLIKYKRANETGNGTTDTCLRDRNRVPPPPPGLEQEKQYIATDGEACEKCFDDHRNSGQRTLFPYKLRTVPRYIRAGIFDKRTIEEMLVDIEADQGKAPEATRKEPRTKAYPTLEELI